MGKLYKCETPVQELNEEISYGQRKSFLYQAVNLLISHGKLSISLWGMISSWLHPHNTIRRTAVYYTSELCFMCQ